MGPGAKHQDMIAYPDEEMDEPGGDARPDDVDKEVADGKEPDKGVLQALLCQ